MCPSTKHLCRILLLVIAMTALVPATSEAQQIWKDITSSPQRISNFFKNLGKTSKNEKNTEIDSYVADRSWMVVGTEPSWLIKTGNYEEHRYRMLSDLIVGEYDINPRTGDCRNLAARNRFAFEPKGANGKEKNKPCIIEKARTVNPNIRVLLLVTAYGDFGYSNNNRDNYQAFFQENNTTQTTFSDSIKVILNTWQNNYGITGYETGLVLDFEGLPDWENKDNDIVNFVKKVRTQVLSENGDYKLYYKLSPNDTYEETFLKGLQEYVDVFIFKGYGLEDPISISATSGSPVEQNKRSLTKIIRETCLDKGIPASSVVAEFPYYGTVYEKNPLTNDFELRKNRPFEAYSNTMLAMSAAKQQKPKYQSDNAFARFETVDKESKNELNYAFDDSLTLSLKYDWAQKMKLKGVGLMGLGYNPRAPDVALWEALSFKYGHKVISLWWIALAFLIFAVVLALPWALYKHWEVRNMFAVYQKYLWYFGGVALALLILVFVSMDIIPRTKTGLFTAALIVFCCGGWIMYQQYLLRANYMAKYIGLKK